jgi:hypothetical protein
MAGAERISTTRPIRATPARIFDLISRPDGHVQIDGSGMLVAAPDAAAVTAVGDTFAMHMDRRPLGDIPGMAEYDVTVIIVGFEQDALLEWSVQRADGTPYGHVYGYRLEPTDTDGTVVTAYCDWSGMDPERKSTRSWPVVPVRMLAASLDKLADIVAEEPTPVAG